MPIFSRACAAVSVGVFICAASAAAAECEKLDGAAIDAMEQKQMLESYCRSFGAALPPMAAQSSSDLPGTHQNTCLSNRADLAQALKARYGISAPQCSPNMQSEPHMGDM